MLQLRDVIVQFLALAGRRGLNKTVLTKLVYFAEIESWSAFSRPLTGTSFYRYHYGAWSPAVADVASMHPAVEAEEQLAYGMYPETRYRLREDVPLPEIPDTAAQLIARIYGRYGRLSAADVGCLSKQSEPMLAATEQGEALDFSVVAPRRPTLAIRSSRLKRASSLLDTSTRGTQEELDARDRAEMRAWAPLRRRAIGR